MCQTMSQAEQFDPHSCDHWWTMPHRQAAVWECAQQLWPAGIPNGLSCADRNVRILSWLSQRGRSWVGSTTIRRALMGYPRQAPVRIRVGGQVYRGGE
jgi:hypothetical protein